MLGESRDMRFRCRSANQQHRAEIQGKAEIGGGPFLLPWITNGPMNCQRAAFSVALVSSFLVSPTARAQSITYGPILGRGATPDQMIVKWGTDSSTGPSSLAFRLQGSGAFQTATGSESENSQHSFDHETVLTGLALDSTYDYQVTAGTAQTNVFTTCPAPGAPMDAVFYGDSRNRPFSSAAQVEHQKVAEQILAKSPDMVFESGDMVYTGEYEDYLSQLFPVVAPLAATIPYMAIPGNHDSGDPFDIDTGGLSVLTSNFGRVFPTPQADPSNWTPYYAFVCGNAMFIGLDSESLVANGDAGQSAFLMDQLASARAQSSIDHVFVWFHHSPYSPASGLLTHGDNATVQSQWVPLFDDPANKVTAVFTGHDHIYARMDDGSHVVYVVSGGAGASASAVGGTSKAATAASKQGFGFVAVHIAGTTVTGTAYDDSGAAFDTWTTQSMNPTGTSGSTSGAGDPAGSVAGLANGCSVGGGSAADWGSFGFVALALVALALRAGRRNTSARC
jgi:3',5'-cyclic AMP phosphodiesterase CpdA